MPGVCKLTTEMDYHSFKDTQYLLGPLTGESIINIMPSSPAMNVDIANHYGMMANTTIDIIIARVELALAHHCYIRFSWSTAIVAKQLLANLQLLELPNSCACAPCLQETGLWWVWPCGTSGFTQSTLLDDLLTFTRYYSGWCS